MDRQLQGTPPNPPTDKRTRQKAVASAVLIEVLHKTRWAAVATIPFWKWLLSELRQIAACTFTQTVRVGVFAATLWRGRSLRRAAIEAQVAFGEQIHEAGQGDEPLRTQVATLDDRIRSVEAAKGSSKALRTERRGILLRLARHALQQGSAPRGVEAAYSNATVAQVAIQTHQQEMTKAKTELAPSGTVGWCRVCIGYSVVPLLVIVFASFGGKAHQDATANHSDATARQNDHSQQFPTPVHEETRKVAERIRSSFGSLNPDDIVRLVEPSVALIQANDGTGTGFVVAKDILATNAHVVRGSFVEDLKIFFPSVDEKQRQASRVIYESESRDLCLIEFKNDQGPLRLAQDHAFQKGEEILIIGNPGVGKNLVLKNAVTTGLLSSQVTLDGHDFYQLSSAINPGNSGGPVLNRKAEVVAIATLKAASEEGIAFGIPVNAVSRALDEALKQDDHARNRINEEHVARSVFRNIRGLTEWHLFLMRICIAAMDAVINNGGTAEAAFRIAKETLKEKADVTEMVNRLGKSAESHLSQIQQSDQVDGDVKKNLLALHATSQEAQRYAETFRGSFNSYSQKCRNLRDELDRLDSMLKIQLNVVAEDAKE